MLGCLGHIRRGMVTFSGIQPSGTPHLGNYLGAIRQWVSSGSSGRRRSSELFSIVDLHALTQVHDASQLRRDILRLTAGLLASGLDPGKCILFQQSSVQEHAELCWVLSTLGSVPALSRMSQYKDKTVGLKDPPLGLLLYPVLQAADILLYKGTHVPIGEDNIQNLELARSLARAFNRTYSVDFFPEPSYTLSPGAKIKSLRNPAKKMSKSDPDGRSCIYISDSPEAIQEKCRKAVTDSNSSLSVDPEGRPGVNNLLLIHSAVTGVPIERVVDEHSHHDTGSFKLVLAEALVEHLRPIREKYEYYMDHEYILTETLKGGNEAAREIASQNMGEVKRIIGFN